MNSDAARTLHNDLTSMEKRIYELETGDIRNFAPDGDILEEARKILVKKLRSQLHKKLKYHRLIEPRMKIHDNDY